MSVFSPQSPKMDHQPIYNPAYPDMDMDSDNYQSASNQLILHQNLSSDDDFPSLLTCPKKPKLSNIDEVMEFNSDPIAGPSNNYHSNSSAHNYADPEPSVKGKGKGKETLASSMYSTPLVGTSQSTETT